MRCEAIAKSTGERCKGHAMKGGRFCWVHTSKETKQRIMFTIDCDAEDCVFGDVEVICTFLKTNPEGEIKITISKGGYAQCNNYRKKE